MENYLSEQHFGSLLWNWLSNWENFLTVDLLIRLQDISQEDLKKENKFADLELKKISAEEMLNDLWFNKHWDFYLNY